MPDMPNFGQLLFPLLERMADDEEHAMSDLRPLLADDIGLSQEQRGAVSGSGNNVFGARVAWAQTGLLHAELVERVSSGVYRITAAGREFLGRHQAGFGLADIRTLAPYVQWRSEWGQGGHVPSEEKLAEFEDLYAEFRRDFPESEEGQRIAQLYTTARVDGQANYEKALATPRPSPEFVDSVMLGLLPYRGTEKQIAQGAWVHWAPSTIGGNYRAFYETQWSSDDDWNKVADNLLAFIQGSVEDPAQVGALADVFSGSRYGKGFQQGMLTPALCALRPSDFYLGNSKTSSTVNYFAGTKHTTSLTSYRAFNQTIHKLVEELTPVLEVGPDSVALVQDRFDMFCHWLVAVRKFDFAGPKLPPKPPEAGNVLAEPFTTIFADYDEAEWAFGLLAAVFELVQFHPAYAYEDFIQGIRPQANEDGDLSYDLVPGRFLDFIEQGARQAGHLRADRRRDQPRQPRPRLRRAHVPARVPRRRNRAGVGRHTPHPSERAHSLAP